MAQTFEQWYEEQDKLHGWPERAKYAAKAAYEFAQPKWLPIKTAPLNVEIIVQTNDGDVGAAVLYEEFAKDDLKLWQPLPKPAQ